MTYREWLDQLSWWERTAIALKSTAVTAGGHGVLPPSILVEIEGKTPKVVLSPEDCEGDPGLAIRAAAVLRKGIMPVCITGIFDTHIQVVAPAEGEDRDATIERWVGRYTPGMLQRMAEEEGALERGEVTEALFLCRFPRDDDHPLWQTIPYRIDQPGGGLSWLIDDYYPPVVAADKGARGRVFDGMSRSVAAKPLGEDPSLIEFLLGQSRVLTTECRAEILARATWTALEDQGFVLLEVQGAH